MPIKSKSKFASKNILITQSQLVNYAGSEMITLELAEYFANQGAKVAIATNVYRDPIKKEFEALRNVTVFELPEQSLDSWIREHPLDLAWIHHQLIPPILLKQSSPSKTKFIFHHMSAYHPLEFPIHWQIEEAMADAILFNAYEIKDIIEQTGVLENSSEIISVFGNPAPDAFYVKEPKNEEVIKKVLVVSNHIPPEIRETIELLKKEGIAVDIFGREENNDSIPRRLKPEDIDEAQMIIAIGKTVQYAIASGIPIYCYDRFGGPGFLDKSNFEKAKYHNFSGRGFGKKSSTDIIKEIKHGYILACSEMSKIHKKYAKQFLISSHVEEVIKKTNKTAPKAILEKDIVSHEKYMEIVQLHAKEKATLDGIVTDLHAAVKTNSQASEAYDAILASRSYKIARILAKIKGKI